MDQYLGKVVRILSIRNWNFDFEGCAFWAFNLKDIAGYAKHRLVQEIIKDL
jgi:hypothetical protein